MTRILVVTPEFPNIPLTGACEQDRIGGMLQLKRLGFDIHVITRCRNHDRAVRAQRFGQEHGISIRTTLYSSIDDRQARKLRRFFTPTRWDGQAYEFFDTKVHEQFLDELVKFQPHLVWFDYTFLWPLYFHAKKMSVPIITRSINFEPQHFLEEDAKNVVDYGKYIGKYYSEYRIVRDSNLVLSINPLEEERYRHMGAKKVINLPLRGLGALPESTHVIRDRRPLKVVFMGSTYNVSHNRRAVDLILQTIAPRVGDDFEFHITGAKLPSEYEQYCVNNVVYEGFVDNLNAFLSDMDIALVPSLSGCGMQQKIFEPLYRGIPTITNSRGVAGYPFEDRTHLLFAKNEADFISRLDDLKGLKVRASLSQASQRLSRTLFGQRELDVIVTNAVQSVL